MKKLYSTLEYRDRTIRIQRKLRRNLEHEGRSSREILSAEPLIQINKKAKRFEVEAPPVFSIRDNTEGMLDFFDKIYIAVKKHTPVFLNLERITALNADAILYMLSMFDYYGSERGYRYFSGNVPDDASSRDYLIASGFFKYVQHSKLPEVAFQDKVLSIKHDSQVHGGTASQVITFALDKLGKRRGPESKMIYGTLIECMGNTRNHAHLGSQHNHRKWWLIARYDEEKRRINFSFLDNGAGIPRTVKLRLFERFRETAFGSRDDAGLILSALRGELRTRTGKEWRGRGLPQIMDFSKKQVIDQLIVVSSRGRVDATTQTPIPLTRKFYGTMLSWDFV